MDISFGCFISYFERLDHCACDIPEAPSRQCFIRLFEIGAQTLGVGMSIKTNRKQIGRGMMDGSQISLAECSETRGKISIYYDERGPRGNCRPVIELALCMMEAQTW